MTADEILDALLGLDAGRRAAILDSGGARGEEARFLIAGFDPFETIEAYGGELRTGSRGADGWKFESVEDDGALLLGLLDERLDAYHVAATAQDASPVCGGACVASFSYDFARRFLRLRSRAPVRNEGVREPDASLAFYDTLLVHDYASGATNLVSVGGEERIRETCDALEQSLDASIGMKAAGVEKKRGARTEDRRREDGRRKGRALVDSNLTREEYVARVERIKEHIFAGDIYQANLTQQFTLKLDAETDAAAVFRRLRREHPASFGAFLRREGATVVSASPERFLRVEVATVDGRRVRRVEAWPIKGTRGRGTNVEDDARLRAELLSSEKERAENVMIVDLMRNDLGRVCAYGSVEVAELCAVQEHPTLFHLVSKVRGVLREEVTAGALLRATFPSGSITGAPKLRAMEIIDEAETVSRGLSMGALGYFSFDGAIDLSVAIRTMTIADDGTTRFNVGGGIVADSCPSAEYEESLLKARALLRALNVAEP
jgi:aminodeoxychorismate synthase component I